MRADSHPAAIVLTGVHVFHLTGIQGQGHYIELVSMKISSFPLVWNLVCPH